MFIQTRIDTRSVALDENFVKEGVSPIGHIPTGNQLSAFRAIVDLIRNDWAARMEGAYSSVIFTHVTDADVGVPLFRSDNRGWETPNAVALVMDGFGFSHYEQAPGIVNTGAIGMPDDIAFALAPPHISRPAAHTSLSAILDTWLENRIQTRVQDAIQGIKEYYEEQLANRDSEIQTLSNELSQIKTVNQYQNHESEQIKSEYSEEIAKIPEVAKIRCKQRKNSIEFLVVINQIRRNLSYQLSQIESQLCDEYTNWFFEFEHVSIRTFSRQSRAGYADLFNRD